LGRVAKLFSAESEAVNRKGGIPMGDKGKRDKDKIQKQKSLKKEQIVKKVQDQSAIKFPAQKP
jgi:hypothetical protein